VIPSDPVIQVALAAFCAAVLAGILFVMSKPSRWGGRSIPRALRAASILVGVVAIGGALHAVRLSSEIEDGDYALLRIAMPVDPHLVPVVSAAMKDGRITYGEYDTMKFKGAIPDRRVMRSIVAQDVVDLAP
jgi:hypothetical protein